MNPKHYYRGPSAIQSRAAQYNDNFSEQSQGRSAADAMKKNGSSSFRSSQIALQRKEQHVGGASFANRIKKDKGPIPIVNNYSGNVAYKPEEGPKPVNITGQSKVYAAIDGLNVGGSLYKVPDETTGVVITSWGIVFQTANFLDIPIADLKKLDPRIYWLDDWEPIRTFFDE